MNEMSMPVNNNALDNYSKSPNVPMANPNLMANSNLMENKVANNPISNQPMNPVPTINQTASTDSVAKPPGLQSNMFKMQRNKCKTDLIFYSDALL